MSRVRWLLRSHYFVNFAAVGAYLPFFPLWLDEQGIRGIELGAITALGPLMNILAPTAFGILADHLGLRGSLLRVCSAVATAGFLLIALAVASKSGLTFWPLFGIMAATTLFRAPLVMLTDVMALEEGSDYGRLRLWGSLGFLAVTLFAAGFILAAPALRVPAAIALGLAITTIISFLLPARAVLPERPDAAAFGTLLRDEQFRKFLLASFLWLASHSAYDLCISMHLAELGASGRFIGWCWALGTAAEIVLMASVGRLLGSVRLPVLLSVGYGATALRWLLLSVVTSPLAILALQPLHAVTFALVWVTATAFVKRTAKPETLATAQGLFVSCIAIGSVSGMLLWSTLFDAQGGHSVFLGATAVALLALGGAWRLMHPFAVAPQS